MEILIAAIVVGLGLAVGLVAGASLLARRVPGMAGHPVAPAAEPARPVATPTVEDDGGLAERRAEVIALEQRLRAREEAVEGRMAELGARERVLSDRTAELEALKDQQVRSLERTAGMSASQASSRRATTRHASCAWSRRRRSATPIGASATSCPS
jgi:hypothetical protein